MVQFSTAKASECNESGDTILHVLLKNYGPNMCELYNKMFLDVIDKCISKGANLNQRNKNEILKGLINLGADLNCQTTSGDDLLVLACKSLDHKSETLESDLKWTEWLVHQGFDVNPKDKVDLTPPHYTA